MERESGVVTEDRPAVGTPAAPGRDRALERLYDLYDVFETDVDEHEATLIAILDEFAATANEAGRCAVRCEGSIGHPGFHQTLDYADIRRDASAHPAEWWTERACTKTHATGSTHYHPFRSDVARSAPVEDGPQDPLR